MKVLFSKRHEQAIFNEELKLYFSVPCRTSIERILSNYSDWGGYQSQENSTFDLVEEELKTFYGTNVLRAYDDKGQRVRASLSSVILKGIHYEVLDIIESWFNQSPAKARECEKELNDIFYIHDSPWRVINGEAMLINSEYLHREIHAKSIRLLEECDIPGALEEYTGAISDLKSGETKDAITKAHKSVESVMKAVLETDERLRFGQLLSRLVESKIVPEYYEGFLKNFEQLAIGIGKERNLPGRGHGQGREATLVSRSLAEFTVNLAGSLNIFILRHWIETKREPKLEEDLSAEDDIQF